MSNASFQLDDSDYARIDEAIRSEKKQENWIIGLSVGIFLLGAGAAIWGFISDNGWIIAPAVLAEIFLYWPIQKIWNIRSGNLALYISPVLIKTLPAEEAAREMVKLLDHLKL